MFPKHAGDRAIYEELVKMNHTLDEVNSKLGLNSKLESQLMELTKQLHDSATALQAAIDSNQI